MVPEAHAFANGPGEFRRPITPAFSFDSPFAGPYHCRVGQNARVAVFGRADLLAGSEGYAQAEELGSLLAGAGYVVLNGGYGGTMEAVSKGASRAGGRVEGVVCRAFPEREPNAFLTERTWTDAPLSRTRLLIDRADAYVALEPRAGTIAEVAALWALRKAGALPPRPLVLVGPAWEHLCTALMEEGTVEKNLLEWSVRVSECRQVLPVLAALGTRENSQHG